MNKEDYKAIVERCEQVRMTLGLNKSRFSAAIGRARQTYNYLIHEGGNPTLDLVRGIIAEFAVSPDWLLFGAGEMFRAGGEPVQLYQASALSDEVRALQSDMEIVKRFMGESFDAIRRRLVEEAGGGVQCSDNIQVLEPPHA